MGGALGGAPALPSVSIPLPRLGRGDSSLPLLLLSECKPKRGVRSLSDRPRRYCCSSRTPLPLQHCCCHCCCSRNASQGEGGAHRRTRPRRYCCCSHLHAPKCRQGCRALWCEQGRRVTCALCERHVRHPHPQRSPPRCCQSHTHPRHRHSPHRHCWPQPHRHHIGHGG